MKSLLYRFLPSLIILQQMHLKFFIRVTNFIQFWITANQWSSLILHLKELKLKLLKVDYKLILSFIEAATYQR